MAVASAIFLFLLILAAVAAPVVTRHDHSSSTPVRLQGISSEYWFGTDGNDGGDVFARVIYGARISLLVGLSVMFDCGTAARSSGCSPATTRSSIRRSCG
ncbi:MAG: hypothetical protein R3A46_10665 [Thermomicrobiales bacterium]